MSDVSALENGQKKMAQDRERGIQFSEDGTVLLKYPDGISDTVYEIPYGIKEIAQYAFADCGELKEVIITGSVMEIKAEAFNKKLNITSCNAKFKVDDKGVLIDTELQQLIYAPPAVSGAYVIPDGITKIGDHAFRSCNGVTGVTISESVTDIGDYAFCENTGLTDMSIPASVVRIGEGAFCGCSCLSELEILNSEVENGRCAFNGCPRFNAPVIPDSVPEISEESAWNWSPGFSPVSITGDAAEKDEYGL